MYREEFGLNLFYLRLNLSWIELLAGDTHYYHLKTLPLSWTVIRQHVGSLRLIDDNE